MDADDELLTLKTQVLQIANNLHHIASAVIELQASITAMSWRLDDIEKSDDPT
jgi:hypothetical protein